MCADSCVVSSLLTPHTSHLAPIVPPPLPPISPDPPPLLLPRPLAPSLHTDSVEDRIMQLQEDKRRVIASALEQDGGGGGGTAQQQQQQQGRLGGGTNLSELLALFK